MSLQLTDSQDKVLEQYLEIFGKRKALVKSIEEMGELIRPLAKLLDGDIEKVVELNIFEEIAHVEIYLHLLEKIFGRKGIQEEVDIKITKLQNKCQEFHGKNFTIPLHHL